MPAAIGDTLILQAVRESGGFAISVSDHEILEAQAEMAKMEGLLLCPEGAAAYAAFRNARTESLIDGDATCVLFNCGSALKYPMPAVTAVLDRQRPIDFGTLISSDNNRVL